MLLSLKKIYWDFSALIKLKQNFRIARQKKNMLGSYASAILYETRNGLISMPIDDMTIGHELATNGHWDLPEIEILQSYLQEDDQLYIVGTHVGTLLIPLARNCAKVIGYEANPSTFKFLQQNLALNAVDNAQVYNLAIGDRNDHVRFLQNKLNSGGSKIKPVLENKSYVRDHPEEIEIEMVTMQEHIDQEKLPQPDAMVMDIEGAEYFALKGMGDYINSLRLLYIEFVPHHLKHVANVELRDFFNMIVPHFNKVRFIRNKASFLLRYELPAFIKMIGEMQECGDSDDLLFIK